MPRLKTKEASGTGAVVGTDSELLRRRAAQDTWVSEGQRQLPVKKQSAQAWGGGEPDEGREAGPGNRASLSPALSSFMSALFIYLTPALQPDVSALAYLHTPSAHSFKGYRCSTYLWPGPIPGTGTALTKQTITQVLGELKCYRGPNAPLL